MADPDAVRQVRERARDREVSIWNSADGMGEVYAQLYATDAQALDARLNALVATVCAGDPRSTDQRRADALGALAAGADRLACRCDNPDCAAEGRPVSAVVIHVVAEQASVKGHGQAPAALLGGDGLIPAELVAELAKTAGLQPIPVPAGTEPGYRPSVKLAAFVRARDLTCRAPGCDRPATQCDLDHTIAFADGGATHAANLKCLCRLHHLLATFCGWRAQQLPDGTVIWTLPGNQTYVTTPHRPRLKARYIASACLSEARYGIVWGAMGAARSAWQCALDYARQRTQFGRPIAGFQLTQAKLVDMAVELHKGQLLSLHLGRLKDRVGLRPDQVSFGKLNNTREALKICRTARTILGGNGISLEYPVIRHMVNLESVLTYEGTPEMHQLVLGQAFTGLAAFR